MEIPRKYSCANPDCKRQTPECSLTCSDCDSLRESGDADICDLCGLWSEQPTYGKDFIPICDSCQ